MSGNQAKGSVRESKTALVYGPEPPPSMARTKASEIATSIRFGLLDHSGANTEDVTIGIGIGHKGDCDGPDSNSVNLSQAESELKKLFRDRLLAAMSGTSSGAGSNQSTHTGHSHDAKTATNASTVLIEGGISMENSNAAYAVESELKEEISRAILRRATYSTFANIDPDLIDKRIFEAAELDKYPSDSAALEVALERFKERVGKHAIPGSASVPFINSNDADIQFDVEHFRPDIDSVGNEYSEQRMADMPSTVHNFSPEDNLDFDGASDGFSWEGANLTKEKSNKKKRKKKKKKSKSRSTSQEPQLENNDNSSTTTISNGSAYQNQNNTNKQDQPPPPPPSMHPSVPSLLTRLISPQQQTNQKAQSMTASKKRDSDAIWSNDRLEEQHQVRNYWLSLKEYERRAFVLVEKEIVLCRVREHQSFSCTCNVCTRKREAIEHELDCLYDCYYEELEESVRREKLRLSVREAEERARSLIMDSANAVVSSVISNSVDGQIELNEEFLRKKLMEGMQIHEILNSEPESEKKGLPSQSENGSAANGAISKRPNEKQKCNSSSSGRKPGDRKPNLSVEEKIVKQAKVDLASAAIKEWIERAFEYRREYGGGIFQNDTDIEDPYDNSDLFYTDGLLGSVDSLPSDSKKFFDMMERLAEYRMRREDALLEDLVDSEPFAKSDSDDEDDNADKRTAVNQSGSRPPRHLRRCPDCQGEISDLDDRRLYSDIDGQQAIPLGRQRSRSMSQFNQDGALVNGYNNNTNIDSYADDLGVEDDILDEHDEDDEDLDDGLDDDDDDVELDPERAEEQAEEGRRVFQLFAARLFEQRVINSYRERVARERQQKLIEELEEEEKRSKAKGKRKQKKKEREKEKKRHLQQQKEEERLAKEAQQRANEERRKVIEEERKKEREKKKREDNIKQQKAQEERNKRILEQADRRLEKEKQEKAEREKREKRARETKPKTKAKDNTKKEKEERERKDRLQAENEVERVSKETPKFQVAQKQQSQKLQVRSQPQKLEQAPMTRKPSVIQPTEHTRLPTSSAPSVSVPIVVSNQRISSGPNQLRSASGQSPIPRKSPCISPQLTPTHNDALINTAILPIQNLKISHPATTTVGGYSVHPPLSAPTAHSLEPSQRPYSLAAPKSHVTNSNEGTSQNVASSEFDAEVMSIVGKVMGSQTLQDELAEGLEWRAEPKTYTNRDVTKTTSNAIPSFGISVGSIPVYQNVLSNDTANTNNSAPNSQGMVMDSGASLAMIDPEVEPIYKAYCALEKFRSDVRSASVDVSGNIDTHPCYYNVSEISQMHGSLPENEIWHLCVRYSQTHPNLCQVDYSSYSVMFLQRPAGLSGIASEDLSNAAITASLGVPLPSLSSFSLGSNRNHHSYESRTTSSTHLSILTDDILGSFSLRSPHVSGSLSANALGAGNAIPPVVQPQPQPQACSPLLSQLPGTLGPMSNRTQSQPQTQTQTPIQSRIPPQLSASPVSGLLSQTQLRHGGNYTPGPQSATGAPMFFNPLSMHNVIGMQGIGADTTVSTPTTIHSAQPFSRPFQNQALSMAGLGQMHNSSLAVRPMPLDQQQQQQPPAVLGMPSAGVLFGGSYGQVPLPAPWNPAAKHQEQMSASSSHMAISQQHLQHKQPM